MAKTVIPIGPYHPLQLAPEFFSLTIEGETVVDVDVRLGYNHRGIEKLSEQTTFGEAAFLMERICGICAASHPFAYALAVEDIIGMQIDERAQFIRTIVAEAERISSHLFWLGLIGHYLGYTTIFMWAWELRDEVIDAMEILTGNRGNYAIYKPGGVQRDFSNNDASAARAKITAIRPALQRLKKFVLKNPVVKARTKSIGVLTKEDCIRYGAVGPVARASGITRDLRKDDPYGAYDKVDWNVVVAGNGDVYDKIVVRMLETFESVNIIDQCIQKLPPGETSAHIKNVPTGEGIGRVEAARGEVFHYIRTAGSDRPVRHRMRSPTFMNLPTYKATVVGANLSDAIIILAAVDPCYACAERVAVQTAPAGKPDQTAELVRRSQTKTEFIKKKQGRI